MTDRRMHLDRTAIEERLRTEQIGRPLLLLDSVPSTQDIARAEAAAGVAEGLVVVAEEQTAGRGRFQREWVSPCGSNLYVTVLLRPDVATLRKLSMVTALALVDSIEAGCGLSTQVKWPNDIVAGTRKLAGILIDSELDGGTVNHALAGAGININLNPEMFPEIAEIATSCALVVGHEVSREAVLAEYLNALEQRYRAATRGDDVRSAWRSRLVTLGQQVRVSSPGGSAEEGVADDVDEDGSLILRRVDGSMVICPAGEVTLRE